MIATYRLHWLLFLPATMLAITTAAQDANVSEDPATLLAYAAGYKAVFTCGGVFNGGKTPAQIAAQELTGVAPRIAEHFATVGEALIDHANRRVSVHFLDGMPPRISQWRPHLGCAQLPVGAPLAAVRHLPRVQIDADGLHADRDDGRPWTTRAPVNGPSGHPALDRVVSAAFEKGRFGADQFTSAVLIATPTAILAERYIDGYSPLTAQRSWSLAKSIGATVIGVAVQQGLLEVGAEAGLARWSAAGDPRQAITLEQLLHMASGLDSDRAGNQTPRLYFGGGTVEDTALGNALEVPPGSRFKYANNDTLLAVRVLRERLGDQDAYLRFPFEQLLYRIGMHHTKLETDWRGDFILSSQVWTTARDVARLGVLHLNDGVWDGERLLPEGWVNYIARPAPAQPGAGAPGYGAQWWLYNERFPEVPDDAFAARGNRGQLLLVIPSRELLIVRRGYDPAGGEGFLLHQFAAAVLAALGGDVQARHGGRDSPRRGQ